MWFSHCLAAEGMVRVWHPNAVPIIPVADAQKKKAIVFMSCATWSSSPWIFFFWVLLTRRIPFTFLAYSSAVRVWKIGVPTYRNFSSPFFFFCRRHAHQKYSWEMRSAEEEQEFFFFFRVGVSLTTAAFPQQRRSCRDHRQPSSPCNSAALVFFAKSISITAISHINKSIEMSITRK